MRSLPISSSPKPTGDAAIRVLLINPPSDHIITTTQAKYIISERGFVPPLGLLYLATSIQERTTHNIRILDYQLHKLNEQQIENEIQRYDPDVVGITTITFMLVDCMKVAQIVKRIQKKRKKIIHVVAGGPHATIYPVETAQLEGIDFSLAGEAEFSFLEFLENLNDQDRLARIPGICFQENGRVIKGPPYAFIDDLDALPVPDRTLLDYEKYANVLAGSGIMTTMITSRGCPYQCIFCERLGKTFRAVSPENVMLEVTRCLDLGIRNIFFHDDTFTIDKKRVMEICRLIRENKITLQFSLRSRVNTIDEEMISELKNAGCTRISFGVESGVQRILNRIKKGITLEQVEKAFALTRKYKITSLADFMIGHPDETLKDIEQTLKFAKKIRPDYVQFSVTTPYPGTDLYREALDKGIVKKDVWKEFAENPVEHFTPPRWEETLDKHSIYKVLHRCYRKFYLNPKFIIRNLMRLNGWNELVRKMKAGMKLALYELLEKLGINRDGFR